MLPRTTHAPFRSLQNCRYVSPCRRSGGLPTGQVMVPSSVFAVITTRLSRLGAQRHTTWHDRLAGAEYGATQFARAPQISDRTVLAVVSSQSSRGRRRGVDDFTDRDAETAGSPEGPSATGTSGHAHARIRAPHRPSDCASAAPRANPGTVYATRGRAARGLPPISRNMRSSKGAR